MVGRETQRDKQKLTGIEISGEKSRGYENVYGQCA